MPASTSRQRTHLGARNFRRATALLVSGCALAVVSACSSDDPKSTESSAPATASQSASPTPLSAKEKAKREAIATYQAHWKGMEQFYADSSGSSNYLEKTTAYSALEQAKTDVRDLHGRNVIYTGHVEVGNPTATSVDVDRKVPNVIISSCLDISKWYAKNSKTNKPIAFPSDRLTKYVIKGTVEQLHDGWRVTRDEPQDTRC